MKLGTGCNRCLQARHQVLLELMAGYTSGAYGQDTRCFGGLRQAIHLVLMGKIPGASGARHLVLGLTAGIHLVLIAKIPGAFGNYGRLYTGCLRARYLVLLEQDTWCWGLRQVYTWCFGGLRQAIQLVLLKQETW